MAETARAKRPADWPRPEDSARPGSADNRDVLIDQARLDVLRAFLERRGYDRHAECCGLWFPIGRRTSCDLGWDLLTVVAREIASIELLSRGRR